MSKWFSPASSRPKVTVYRVSDEGVLASDDEKSRIFRISLRGYRELVTGEEEADGRPIEFWVKREENLPKLEVGTEVIVIQEGGDEMRCQLNNCDKCGKTDCIEHSGEGGKGPFAPIFHVASRWTVERRA